MLKTGVKGHQELVVTQELTAKIWEAELWMCSQPRLCLHLWKNSIYKCSRISQ